MSNFDLSKLSSADKTKMNLLKLKQLQSMFLNKPTFKPSTSSTTIRTTLLDEQNNSNANTKALPGGTSTQALKTTKTASPSTERYNGIGRTDVDQKKLDAKDWPGMVERKQPAVATAVITDTDGSNYATNYATNFAVAMSSRPTGHKQEAEEEEEYSAESYEEEMEVEEEEADYESQEAAGWPYKELAKEPLGKPSWDLQRAQHAMMESIKAQQAEERQALERQAMERQALERKALEKQALERQAAQKQAAERQAYEKEAAERQAAERQAAERQAAERQAAERQAAERQAAERQAAERQAYEREAAEMHADEKKDEEKLAAAERLVLERKALEKQVVEMLALERPTSDRQTSERYDPDRLTTDSLASIEMNEKRTKQTKSSKFEAHKRPRPSYAPDSPATPPASDNGDAMVDPYHSSVAYGQPVKADNLYQTSFGHAVNRRRPPGGMSTTTEKTAVVVNGQAFLDMSGGTRMVADNLQPLRLTQEEEKEEVEASTEAVMMLERRGEEEDNQVEAVSTASATSSSNKPEDEFTTELCDKLRVPCRYCILYIGDGICLLKP